LQRKEWRNFSPLVANKQSLAYVYERKTKPDADIAKVFSGGDPAL